MKTQLKQANARIVKAIAGKKATKAERANGHNKAHSNGSIQKAAALDRAKVTQIVDQISEPIVAVETPVEPIVPVAAETKAGTVIQHVVLRAGELKAGLRHVERALGKTLPILSSILVEVVGEDQLKFTATNLEIALWHLTSAKVLSPGRVCFPQILSRVIANVDDDQIVTLATNEKTRITTVEAGRRKTHLKTEAPDDFPVIAPFNGKGTFTFTLELVPEQVTEIIKRILPFTATDDTRLVLTAIHLAGTFPEQSDTGMKLAIMSADGFRLAYLERDVVVHFDGQPGLEKLDVLVPPRVFTETLKLSPPDGKPIPFAFHLTLTKNDVVERGMVQVELAEGGVRMNLVDGKFPELEPIMKEPEQLTIIPLAVDETQAALAGAELFNPGARLACDPQANRVTIAATSADLGDFAEQVSAPFDPLFAPAPGFEIAFNADFLSGAVKAAAYGNGDGPVLLRVSSPASPGYLYANPYRHILMPMHLNGSAEAKPAPAESKKETAPAEAKELKADAPQLKAAAPTNAKTTPAKAKDRGKARVVVSRQVILPAKGNDRSKKSKVSADKSSKVKKHR